MFVLLRRGQFLRTWRVVSQNHSFVDQNSKTKLTFLSAKGRFSSESSPAHVECNLTTLPKKRTKNQKSSTQLLEKLVKTTSFLKKKHFMRKRLQSHRLHVWQSCRNKLSQKSEKVLARRKVGEKYFIEAFSSSKCSPRHFESRNDAHALRIYFKGSQNLSQTSCVPPKALLEALKAFWQNAIKNFTELWQVFRWRTKNSGNKFFIEAFFPQITLVDTRNSVYKTTQIFFAKSQKISRQNQKPKIFFSPKYTISWKTIFWRHNLHFWQPSPKVVHQKPKITTHKFKKHINK